MKSFDVNLHNKRLQIAGIFNKTTNPKASEEKSVPLVAHCPAVNILPTTEVSRQQISQQSTQHSLQQSSSKISGQFFAKIPQSKTHLFYFTLLFLHIAAVVTGLVVVFHNTQATPMFANVLHMGIVVLSPLGLVLLHTPVQQTLILLLHLCGLYAWVSNGLYATTVANSIYVFYFTLLLVQMIQHQRKSVSQLQVELVYYSIHVLAILALGGLWALRNEALRTQTPQRLPNAPLYAQNQTHSLQVSNFFDVTALVTALMLVVCDRLF